MSSENAWDHVSSTQPDPLVIHAMHTVLDFRRAHQGNAFVSPEAEWRSFVAFQTTALLRAATGGKYHLQMTRSQQMALIDLIGEVLICSCPHVDRFIDCSSDPAISTTPGDLLRLISEAVYEPLGYDEFSKVKGAQGRRVMIENKFYEGFRAETSGCVVRVNGRTLPSRVDLFNHSPTGFEWGYSGSGPAQLALAILADCLGDDERAVRLHQDFKFNVVGAFEHDKWTLTDSQVMDAVLKIESGGEQK
jgi:Family of unknown function (DUF6166)